MNAFWRSGGGVGQGVEEGVGVGAEFLAVAGQAGGEVDGKGLEAFLSDRFVAELSLWKVEDSVQSQGGLLGRHADAADGGEELGELVPHLREGAGSDLDFQLIQGFLAVGRSDGGDFFREDDAIGAVLAHETDVEPEGAGAVEAVGDAEEGGEGIVFADSGIVVIQHVGAVHEVDVGAAEGAGR